MTELDEVFEMTTKQMEPDQDSWNQQERRQRRTTRNRKVGAFAIVACIVAGTIVASVAINRDPGGSARSVGAARDGAQPALSVVDVDSGMRSTFTAPPGASEFDVSLDGSMVTYSERDANGTVQVFVMDADGSNPRQLTHGALGGNFRGPSWSPDGSMIAYEAAVSDESQIFVVRLSDGVSTQVTHEPRGAVDPGGWAPDGGSLIFSTRNAASSHYTARSLDLASGRSSLVVPDGSTPTLSPDGSRIAFNSWVTGHVRLIIAQSDGSQRQVIARFDIDDGYQRWSPDSTRLAFIDTTNDGLAGTFVYDLATGDTRFVTTGTVESWTDDGHILVSG